MIKRTLLTAIALTTLSANAQQKLIGLTTTAFDPTGSIVSIDSSEYVYNSWDGSLFANEPAFIFEGAVMDWLYELPAIMWDTENVYGGDPMLFDYSRQNTIVSGNATVSERVGSDKTEFAYDGSGNVINKKDFYFDITQYVLYAEQNFEYNANNDLTIEEYISYPSGSPIVESIDSLFYDGSNNLIRYASYNWDGVGAFYATSESLMTYVGNEITDIELYDGGQSSPLEWIYDIDYTYTSGLPNEITAYPVTGGVPDATAEIVIQYFYNTANQISNYEGFLDGDLFAKTEYTYDAQDFISKIVRSEFDSNTTALYIYETADFYYQSTVGVEELVFLEAKVFPNPSSDIITLTVDDEVEQLSIFGTDGKLMLTQKDETVDISRLPAGVYIVKVKTSTGIAQTRFVKK